MMIISLHHSVSEGNCGQEAIIMLCSWKTEQPNVQLYMFLPFQSCELGCFSTHITCKFSVACCPTLLTGDLANLEKYFINGRNSTAPAHLSSLGLLFSYLNEAALWCMFVSQFPENREVKHDKINFVH